MRGMIRAWGTICVVLALLLVGCGGGSDSSSTVKYRPFHIPVEKGFRTADQLRPGKNGLMGPELKPVIPDSPPPEYLVMVDLLNGAGNPAIPSDRLTVQYVGAVYDSGKKFASSWDEGKPFIFTLGKGEVIQGWEEGIEGMEVSDRRELVVPPELVTGGSRMKDVPKGSTLVFVIELLDLEHTY